MDETTLRCASAPVPPSGGSVRHTLRRGDSPTVGIPSPGSETEPLAEVGETVSRLTD